MAAAAQDEATELTNEALLEAQAHVWNHVFSYISSMSLKAAIQLQIPDIIHRHGKPMTLSQLASALPMNKAKTQSIRRLMRVLTQSKFFIMLKIATGKDVQEEEEEAYGLTAASRLLVQGEPMSLASFSLASFSLAMLDPIVTDPWHRLSEWFGDECEMAFVTEHGMMMWELVRVDRRWNLLFNDGMESDSRLVSRVLVKECRHVFEGLTSMVDVGGGTGTVAKAVAEEFPGLKCIVLDLPHVVAGLQDDQNLSFISGEMFKFIPPADAILLKWILHDWGDEDCAKLLKRCRQAIVSSNGNGGKVIILEFVVKDQQESKEATKAHFFFDMLMMVEVGGKERSEKEWAELFYAAGFTRYEIHPLLGLRSVIEVFP